MLAIVAPGQGAQTPGFLTPWLEVEGFGDHLSAMSSVLGIDLAAHGTTSDADTIRDTAVAQPLLVASALAACRALFQAPGLNQSAIDVTAGHSVGEIGAAVIAGVLSEHDALVFVRERGAGMAAAAAAVPTGMTAVLGGDPDEVLAALARAGLTPANANGAGQVVAAGTFEQLAALAADPPAKARLIPLTVAGAFHTVHMAPAVDALSTLTSSMTANDPSIALLSNADGQLVHSGAQALTRLVSQVASPVRWDLCMQQLADLGVTGLLELPPAGTLTGLARRGLPGVATFALKTPDQLEAAREFCLAHSSSTVSSDTEQGL